MQNKVLLLIPKMDIMKYIEDFLAKGGIIKRIPLGTSGLEQSSVPRFWVENDNVIRINFHEKMQRQA
jgi:hypothetical protein